MSEIKLYDNEIRFTACVYKVSTLADNGIRVTLDLAEDCTMQMAQLAECQRFGAVLDMVARPQVKTDMDLVETLKVKNGS